MQTLREIKLKIENYQAHSTKRNKHGFEIAMVQEGKLEKK